MKHIIPILLCSLFICGGCTNEPQTMEIGQEIVALEATPALPSSYTPVAAGTKVQQNDYAIIDYSNAQDGYVMVKFTKATEKKLKVQVTGATTTYTYNLPQNKWETFPLSDGNEQYKVVVYQNVAGTKYSAVLNANFYPSMTNEFAPFLMSNQYVNFENAAITKAKAQELCSAAISPLDKVEKVYTWVVGNVQYDYQLAATVQSGYLPTLDNVMTSHRGICFDYAALMTGMLRSQNVPCKLVVGYAGTAYHAWISVWSENDGWIDGAIYFDGKTWQRMDPTFASTGNQSETVMNYIGNGTNYTAKYFY